MLFFYRRFLSRRIKYAFPRQPTISAQNSSSLGKKEEKAPRIKNAILRP
jgi:hypothetical protein